MSYKKWIIVAVLLFGSSLIFGIATPSDNVGFLAAEFAELMQIARLYVPFRFSTAIFILMKNASSLLIGFALSPLLCLVPVLALVFNGWLLGFVSNAMVQEKSLFFVLGGLLPHGVFEIPAFIIGEAAALSFGAMLLVALFKKERRPDVLPRLRTDLKYLMMALALLVPAALVETYVTPLLIT